MIRAFAIFIALLIVPQAFADEAKLPNPIVTIKTSNGSFTLRLFRDKAPITVENFLAYLDEGFYNGTIFHRVIPDMMIQGGGMLPDMTKKETRDPIVSESKNRLHNVRGSVSMARFSNPDSATSQFFINVRNNLYMDWAPGREGYTVFGEVIEGMKVVDYIVTAPTATVGNYGDVPIEPVVIIEAKRQSLL